MLLFVRYTILALAVFLISTSILPATRLDWWWVRIWDFPRLQLLGASLVVGVVLAMDWQSGVAAKALLLMLIASAIWQASWIYPYTPLARCETEAATLGDRRRQIHLMVSNVLETNRRADDLLALVHRVQPDVLVVVEVNGWWHIALQRLKADFAHVVEHPLENGYGISLYSRLPLARAEVRHMVEKEIPSIDATVTLPCGQEVHIFAVHPEPPRPGSNTDDRDGELVLVGREVDRRGGTAVVLGDLNDVGWSQSTRLFQKVGRLLDPRKGRGVYATYNAKYPLLRYPLDYLFHTEDLRLVELEVLPACGSDHFPLRGVLSYEPQAEATQEAPKAGAKDHKIADETIEKARSDEGSEQTSP